MGADATGTEAEPPDSDPHWIHRTATGWRVASEDVPDLLNAIVLADLLHSERGDGRVRRDLPPRSTPNQSEVERLRTTISQLEHALQTRVAVEQAIGVLAERHKVTPRAAFDELRHAARCRGRKVAELAVNVVRSCDSPLVALPRELAREGSVVES